MSTFVRNQRLQYEPVDADYYTAAVRDMRRKAWSLLRAAKALERAIPAAFPKSPSADVRMSATPIATPSERP